MRMFEVRPSQRLKRDLIQFTGFNDRVDTRYEGERTVGRGEADRVGRRKGDPRLLRVHRREEIGEHCHDEQQGDQDQADHPDDRSAQAAPDQAQIAFATPDESAGNRFRRTGGGAQRRVDRRFGHSVLAPPSRTRGSRSTRRMSEMMLPIISVVDSTSMNVAVTQTSPTLSDPTIAGPTVGSEKTIAVSISPVSI